MNYINNFVRSFINQPKASVAFESSKFGQITFNDILRLINNIYSGNVTIDFKQITKINASPRLDNALQILVCMMCGLKVSVDEDFESKTIEDNKIYKIIVDMLENNLQKSNKYEYQVIEDKLVKNIEEFELEIKTSGSTGKPSYVFLSGACICYQAVVVANDIKQYRSDRQLMYMPFNYVYGLSVLMTSFHIGSTLVESSETLEKPKSFFEQIKNKSITIFSGVPFVYNLMVKRWGVQNLINSNLRILTQAGGSLEDQVKAKVLSILPNVDFWIMYGQTEFCGRITQFNLTKNTNLISSAGKAINGVKLLRQDKDISEGEIFVSSISVAKNISELAECVNYNGRKYYSTGDIGFIENGYIYITGRNKGFVKVAGSRVNLTSIEKAFKSLNDIFECVVEYDDKKFPVLLIGLCYSGSGNFTSQNKVKKLFESKLSNEPDVIKVIKNTLYYIFILEGAMPRLSSNKVDIAKVKRLLREHFYEKKTIHIRL